MVKNKRVDESNRIKRALEAGCETNEEIIDFIKSELETEEDKSKVDQVYSGNKHILDKIVEKIKKVILRRSE